MIADLKPYPTMKESGIEWLGDVPAHWEVRRLKQVCRLAYGDTLATDVRQDGPIPVFGSNGHIGFHNSANTKSPCIVIGRKGSFGKVNYSRDPVFAIDTTFFVDSRFSSAHIRWLYFLLGWLRLDGVSKDSAVPGLDREDAYQKLAAFPPYPEQAAIVRFLDHADRRIRRYIRAKQKLIALLEEQKQALIHQAVTGQIDVRTGQPYPAYRPSGVEWLGDVPEHWMLKRFKFLAQVTSGQVDPRRPEYRGKILVAPNHIRSSTGEIVHLETAEDQGADSGKYEVRRGQVIYSKIRPNLRKAAIAPLDCLCSADMYPITVREAELWPAYLLLLLLSPPFTKYAIDCSLRVAMPKVNRDALGGCWIWYPSLKEQDSLLEFTKSVGGPSDLAVAQAAREVSLLREYRTSLIADVVTGKLDVREASASLPEVDPAADEEDLDDTLDIDPGAKDSELALSPEEVGA